LGKPVVVTGSMVPLANVHNDAQRNIVVSTLVAADLEVPEVCLFINERLLRGCRSTKVDSVNYDSFESPNFPPLATLGVKLDVQNKLLLPQPRGRLRVHHEMETRIVSLKLFPGFCDDAIMLLIEHAAENNSLRAIVFETYGTGNVPNARHGFLKAVKLAMAKGILVVITSQCLRGQVQLGMYKVGRSLYEAGAIPSGDMTTEAAGAKLAYLFGLGHSNAEVSKLMGKSLRGEITTQGSLTLTLTGTPTSVRALRIAPGPNHWSIENRTRPYSLEH